MQQKFNDLMKEYYVTFDELATRLGVSKRTLTKKFNGSLDWTFQEMLLIAQIFNISDI